MSRFEDDVRTAVEKLIATELRALGDNVPPKLAREFQKRVNDLKRELRVIRNSQLTIVVDRAHEGAPMTYQTPDEGRRIEMSWEQANRVHQISPLRLHTVISEDAAEFVPAIGQGQPDLVLPMPPYELPIDCRG